MNSEPLIFTLGNSAFRVLVKKYNEEQIIEVANFVYDSLEIAKTIGSKKIIFLFVL